MRSHLSRSARSAAALCARLCVSLLGLPLSGQDSSDVSGAGPGFHAEILGGQTGFGGGVHRFGGAHASMTGERWGGGLQLHVGSGSGFSSTFFSGGPSFRIPLHSRADLQLSAGAAYYRESLDTTGRTGSVIGPSASALVRIPVGGVHLAVGAAGWYASYTDEIAVNAVPAEGLRLFIGVGR